MASGNHTCNGNCADLPTAPAKIPSATRVAMLPAKNPDFAAKFTEDISNTEPDIPALVNSDAFAAKISPPFAKRYKIASKNPKSPSLVTKNAFLAAAVADGL